MKFHGDHVENMAPNSRVLRFNKVFADGATKTFDIGIEWSQEAQGLRIISVFPR